MNIITGIFLVVAGALMSIKADWITRNFGHSEWAETKMGAYGGTRTLIKLVGIGAVVLGMLMATGLIKNLIVGLAPAAMLPEGSVY